MAKEKNIDLLHGPILKSLAKLSLPIMATSMVQMAYNLTDMAWIGRAGSGAVAAVGAAGMYTWLSGGVVTLARMGGQVKVAHALGEKNQKEAAEYGKGAIQLTIFLALLYGVVSICFASPLIGFFRLSSEKIVRDAEIYLQIACGLIVFNFLNQTLTGLYTALGDSRTPFVANCIGMVMNMVLDPVLIFGIGPFPYMGVMGAAAATVTAQFIVTFVMVWHIRGEKILFSHIHLLKKPSLSHMKIMIKIGFPSSVQNMIYCGISMILTRFVAVYGDAAVAALRVGGQIESISWTTAEGFGAAINAFVAQNFGGRRYKRVKKGYMNALFMMAVWGIFTTCLLVFGCGTIFSLFIHEAEVIPVGMSYLRILGYSQLFMCVELMTVGAMSGLGKTLPCSVISISLTSARIPLAVVLGGLLGLNGIWWAFTVSSVAKGITFLATYLHMLKGLPAENCLSDSRK